MLSRSTKPASLISHIRNTENSTNNIVDLRVFVVGFQRTTKNERQMIFTVSSCDNNFVAISVKSQGVDWALLK